MVGGPWILTSVPRATLAGREVDGRLLKLATREIEDLTTDEVNALFDDGDIEEDVLQRRRTEHWSSKLGGAPSFSQATLRARSRSRGVELPFLGQLRGDVIYDRYGYSYYLFGDVSRGELAITAQR